MAVCTCTFHFFLLFLSLLLLLFNRMFMLFVKNLRAPFFLRMFIFVATMIERDNGKVKMNITPLVFFFFFHINGLEAICLVCFISHLYVSFDVVNRR
ncbi:hypothetical protein V1514DRAFT_223982 [Lipomyces japonicus]|uniref:uncharacterized protein n=1 Tax=Lipomyces japonicus TaxID=56871 RepID=UPI0034CE9116